MSRTQLMSCLVVSVVLVGCETTGGTIGGLFSAPKFLKGEIQNNTYMAQDKSFSVSVPHKEGSYEYKYMQVKESYAQYSTYVSFGPAAFDQTIYRVETAKRVTLDSQNVAFDDVAKRTVENYKAQLQQGYGTNPKEVKSSQEKLNDKNAYYWQLTQTVPAGKLIHDREATLTHEVYVIEFEKGIAIVWVEIPEVPSFAEINPRSFAESVVMY